MTAVLAIVLAIVLAWGLAVWGVTRLRYVPRYPTQSIIIPDHLGPFPLTDAEIVEFFLKLDWARRMDRAVPATRGTW